jgi:hypothetical protein
MMNERKVYCACCGRDITQRLKFWYGTVEHKEPFCYDCSQKRVKREKKDETERSS